MKMTVRPERRAPDHAVHRLGLRDEDISARGLERGAPACVLRGHRLCAPTDPQPRY